MTVLHAESTLGKRGTGTASRLSSWRDTLHRASRRSFSEGGRPAPSNTPRSMPSATLMLRQSGLILCAEHPPGAVFWCFFPRFLCFFAERTQLCLFITVSCRNICAFFGWVRLAETLFSIERSPANPPLGAVDTVASMSCETCLMLGSWHIRRKPVIALWKVWKVWKLFFSQALGRVPDGAWLKRMVRMSACE